MRTEPASSLVAVEPVVSELEVLEEESRKVDHQS
jgi:hypothetical protein